MANERFTDWLHRAKERAAQMEHLAPFARAHELQPLTPAAPTWLEPNTRPIELEQPCGFVKSMIARDGQTKGFRVFNQQPRNGARGRAGTTASAQRVTAKGATAGNLALPANGGGV